LVFELFEVHGIFGTMKRLGKIAICLASGLVLSAGVRADDVVLPNNPYAPAVVRNVFGLNPPQPVDLNAAAPADPPPKITPNGIMSIFGHLQVLFKVAVPAKAGQPAKDESYILSEGQRQDEIEVIKIDEKNSQVTFNNHGIVQELALAKANAPGVNAPAVPAMQGAGDNSGRGRLGGRPGGGGFGAARNRGSGNDANQNPNIPPSAGNSGQQQPQNTMTAEVQMIMIAAQHAKAQQEGDPTAPLYPPTPIDTEAGVIPPPTPK
jgi:hypothetical protein